MGAQRSGTSKMRDYFVEIWGLPGHNESHIFRMYSALQFKAERIRKDIPPKAYTFHRIGAETILRTLLDQLIAMCNQQHGGPAWVDKTPFSDMLPIAPDLLRAMPNARIVYIARNGLNAVLSNFNRLRRPEQPIQINLFRYVCEHWTNNITEYRKVEDALREKSLFLRQEQLLTSPVDVHRQISKFLDREAGKTDEQVIDFFQKKTISTRSADYLVQKHHTLDVFPEPEYRSIFRELCAENMQYLGYEICDKA